MQTRLSKKNLPKEFVNKSYEKNVVKENDPKKIGQKIIHDQKNLIKKILAKNKIGQRKFWSKNF